MKSLRYFVYVALVIGFIAIEMMSAAAQPVENLKFNIRLEKDTFLLREPIWVDLYFTNENKENVALDCLDLCWQMLKVNLVNSKGDTLEYCGYIADGICRSGPIIKPTETYRYYVNLSENFGIGAREYLPPALRYFKDDTYTLQMIHNGVSSNLIRFQVNSAKGVDQHAYNLLQDASRSGFKYYDKDAQQVIHIFEKLTSKYPISPYTELAFYELAGLNGLTGQPEKSQECLRKLILNYPNSHFSLNALTGLLQKMTKEEQKGFLKEVIKKHPKTRVSDCAENFLKTLEENGADKK